jgi:EAL domain-containing protein (putative c-di-GMP-specific phosphodiesterase class I)
VVGLGRSLGLLTVAEGIEDAATAATLRDMGCDIGQGWLFGQPATEAEVGALACDGVVRSRQCSAAS